METSVRQGQNGTKVTVTVRADDGYQVDGLIVKTVGGADVPVTRNQDGTFTFTLPSGNVTVMPLYTSKTVKLMESGGYATDNPAPPEETGVADWLITDRHPAYISGFSDGTFKPNNNVTRAQTAMMFYRLLRNQNVAHTTEYSDMNGNEWYAEAVYALSSLGIIQGYSDGTFHGNDSISRAAFTAIAIRFAKSNAATAYESYGTKFTDVPDTHWAKDTIAKASYYGWIGGYSDGSFHPADPISRAAVTAIINRMLGRSADTAFITAHSGDLKQFSDVQDSSAWYYYNVAEAANGHSFTKSDGKESWNSVNP